MPFPVPRLISGISVGRAGWIAADLFVHKKFIPSRAEETTTDDFNNNAFNITINNITSSPSPLI
jgi:hypothetical protein